MLCTYILVGLTLQQVDSATMRVLAFRAWCLVLGGPRMMAEARARKATGLVNIDKLYFVYLVKLGQATLIA